MIEEISTKVGVARAATEGTRRRPRWWLIAKTENGRVEFLTTTHGEDGGETLPVFGHEEEAEMFLHLGRYDDSWSARESSSGEIISVLCGPCSGVASVALDPIPEIVDDGTPGLVRLRRENFLGRLLGHPRFISANRNSRQFGTDPLLFSHL
jgi:hypothetical protein